MPPPKQHLPPKVNLALHQLRKTAASKAAKQKIKANAAKYKDDYKERIRLGQPMLPPDQIGKLSYFPRYLHDWYSKRTKNDLLSHTISLLFFEKYFQLEEKQEFFIQLDLLYDLYNRDALDVSLVRCWTLSKALECEAKNLNIGFLDPNEVNIRRIEENPSGMETYLQQCFVKLQDRNFILLPYNFNFHWILVAIFLERSRIVIFYSLNNPQTEFKQIKQVMNKAFGNYCKISQNYLPCQKKFIVQTGVPCNRQGKSNHLCDFYVCHFMEKCINATIPDYMLEDMNLPERPMEGHELLFIQENLTRFFVENVLSETGPFYDVRSFDEAFWSEKSNHLLLKNNKIV
ncbi:unnamed protein product [Urochloa humidicola]